MTDQIWYSILLNLSESADAESIGFDLIDAGAAGTEIAEDGKIRCYLHMSPAELEDFKTILKNMPVVSEITEEVPQVNWVQKCQDVWQELKIDNLTIKPVMSIEEHSGLPPAKDNEIYIIPGCGFGTGHHATTNQATAILQSPVLKSVSIKRCLDVGTGSGLLAIVANKLFNASVDAIDNDPDAIRNAKENALLNKVEDSLNIQVADAALWSNGEYDLVMANLYAELLEQLHDTLYKSTGKWLLISGFHTPELPELKKYAEPLWQKTDVRTSDNWSAVLLKKL